MLQATLSVRASVDNKKGLEEIWFFFTIKKVDFDLEFVQFSEVSDVSTPIQSSEVPKKLFNFIGCNTSEVPMYVGSSNFVLRIPTMSEVSTCVGSW